MRIVDIACGDSHALVVRDNHEVFAWGNNVFGQCGQGHSQSPVLKPTPAEHLHGIPICQISTGTSHSIAWTTPPPDNHSSHWNRPFCIDVHPTTFELVLSFLDSYSKGFSDNSLPQPFETSGDHEKFILTCVKLLHTHLYMASKRKSSTLLGKHATPMMNLLVGLLDSRVPANIRTVILELLTQEASLLLPPLFERIKLLHQLLPETDGDWNSLSQGQTVQLHIILRSVRNQKEVASILNINNECEEMDMNLLEALMTSILKNLASNSTVDGSSKVEERYNNTVLHNYNIIESLRQLLLNLQLHLVTFCSQSESSDSSTNECSTQHLESLKDLLLKYSTALFSCSKQLLAAMSNKIAELAFNEHFIKEKVSELLIDSPAGSALLCLVHSLLLLPVQMVTPLLDPLQSLLKQLNSVNSSIMKKVSSKNVWLLDVEKCCSYVIGRVLNNMLLTNVEANDRFSPLSSLSLFNNGLETGEFEDSEELRELVEGSQAKITHVAVTMAFKYAKKHGNGQKEGQHLFVDMWLFISMRNC
ncbi:hypothetical protein EB796_000600 [Bugula neritina]|uniref:HERC1 n=1 Tax=Bugula neritina TaxID=10212 RepID=A0A7J7KSC1_BUGNE|nr:hypothetical protein EB796_000600 [Bugula neritina]